MGRIMVAARRYARTSGKNCVKFVAISAIFMVALLLKSYFILPKRKHWKITKPVRRRPF